MARIHRSGAWARASLCPVRHGLLPGSFALSRQGGRLGHRGEGRSSARLPPLSPTVAYGLVEVSDRATRKLESDGAVERVAVGRRALLVPDGEPVLALRRGSMSPRFRVDATLDLLLDSVVANGRGRIKR